MITTFSLSDNPLLKKTQAAERNVNVILEVLKRELPKQGAILEIGSGTGQHGATFARSLPSLRWIPSDINSINFASINAWNETVTENRPELPRVIDASSTQWNVDAADGIVAIVAINIIHISNWNVTEGILVAANKILPAAGILFLYGPFIQSDVVTVESNLSFHEQLKSQNSEWGLRNLDAIEKLAHIERLDLKKIIQMPANNLSVIFQKR